MQCKLDEDQLQRVWIRNSHGEFGQEWLISESDVYAVLILHYDPENRGIRHWITRHVTPRLRQEECFDGQRHYRGTIPRQGRNLELLHWQDTIWLRLSDFPALLRLGYPIKVMRWRSARARH
ncbi:MULTISPECIES: phage antirepressor [unclassified Pseudomonas]|uniref:phage antirepressor n=1 Tax=unclassified Pseudomonas TaxID=196821 RepID=UPI00129D285D|nr:MULTISPECIES: phage antirepressor [unclassified Pseudomonas]MDH4651392.1 phage antirepressor [Pseudomonas sp. BN606]MRK23281.1 phage antirepressor [Pseudomonas sp. JG-B]